MQQKGTPKAEAPKAKKRAAKPKPKPTPKAKPRPKPKPKPKPLAPPAGDAVKPRPEPRAKPKPLAKQMLTPAVAARRYEDGPAQVRLGQLYDRGSAAVERDYATSLGWYQKARDNGMQIPKPHTYPAGR